MELHRWTVFSTEVESFRQDYVGFRTTPEDWNERWTSFEPSLVQNQGGRFFALNTFLIGYTTEWTSFQVAVEVESWYWYTFQTSVQDESERWAGFTLDVENSAEHWSIFRLSELTDTPTTRYAKLKGFIEDRIESYIGFSTTPQDTGIHWTAFTTIPQDSGERWTGFQPSILQDGAEHYLSSVAEVEGHDTSYAGFFTTPQDSSDNYLRYAQQVEGFHQHYIGFVLAVRPTIIFSPVGGSFDDWIDVNILVEDMPVHARITLDRTEPNLGSALYSGEVISITRPKTIWIKGYWAGGYEYDRKEEYIVPTKGYVIHSDMKEVVTLDEEILWQ